MALKDRVKKAIEDKRLQETLGQVMSHFRENREKRISEIPYWEEWRERLSNLKEEVLERWDELHRLAGESLRKKGIEVFYARDAEEARRIVEEIAEKNKVKSVVKSKSMVSEEIGLNSLLESKGIEVTETDLGEFIVQLAGESPFHIVAPALHKKKEEVQRLFRDKLGVEVSSEISQLTLVARRYLRERFLQADMGITGANFVVANTGKIVIVENEGNARMCVTYPRIHVAIVGEEKLIKDLEDLALFLPMLTISATGQRLTSYVNILGGPDKFEGPEKRYLIFLDNGRREILKDGELRVILKCIRCAACLNICPIYNKIGGHAYGWVYSGPIGSLLTYKLKGSDPGSELPFLSTLCGACDEVCPVKIPITRTLLLLRRRITEGKEQEGPKSGERFIFWLWSKVLSSPSFYRRTSTLLRKVKSILGFNRWRKHHLPPLRDWSKERDFPPLSEKTFLDGVEGDGKG
jgi:L-lactate dehydrogenase complex protein LldF